MFWTRKRRKVLVNQDVAYKAEPGLWGKLIVRELADRRARCEVVDTQTPYADGRLEWFKLEELVPYHQAFRAPTNTPDAMETVTIPDAPPDDL